MDNPRIKVFFRLCLILFAVVIVRVFYLQNFDPALKTRSELNRVRTLVVEPSRGRIFDRNGELLVDNQYAYNLYVVPEVFLKNEKTILFVSEKLKLNKDSVVKELDDPRIYRDRYYRLARDIDFSVYSAVMEKGRELRGISVRKEWTRKFLINTAPHIIGYLGEAKDKDELTGTINYGDLIGKEGIEFIYDSLLRGEKGFTKEIKDVKGNKVSDYKREEWKDAKRGSDIYLTIDLKLQLFVEKLLEKKAGTIIVENCRNGEILALASKPDYPLEIFSRKMGSEEWKKWSEDPQKPLYNKAIMGLYPPGSVVKMGSVIAAAEQKIKLPNDRVHCPGGMQIGDRWTKCWLKTGHGSVDMTLALMMSCDTYFYDIAQKIDIDKWKAVMQSLGLGSRTGVDLKYERSGLVPGYDYYRKRISGDLSGRYANLMIGQGEMLTTPLQISNFTSVFANGGKKFIPHLLLKYGDEGNFGFFEKAEPDTVEMDKNILSVIKRAMRLVVNTAGGTAFKAKSSIVEFAGKTGTAQNPHGEDHAWFTSFGPYSDPEITVTIFEEHGVAGSTAALLAKDVYEFYYINKKAPQLRGEND
jgi:penicillin-binding protein 2